MKKKKSIKVPEHEFSEGYYKISHFMKSKPNKDELMEFVKRNPKFALYVPKERMLKIKKDFARLLKEKPELAETFENDLEKNEKIIMSERRDLNERRWL